MGGNRRKKKVNQQFPQSGLTLLPVSRDLIAPDPMPALFHDRSRWVSELLDSRDMAMAAPPVLLPIPGTGVVEPGEGCRSQTSKTQHAGGREEGDGGREEGRREGGRFMGVFPLN